MNRLDEMSRREFVAYTGGAVGVLALAGAFAKNLAKIDVRSVGAATHRCDVLVVGGGMAALFAAVKAHDAGAKVVLVSKGRVGSSGQTPFAKGIFVYDPENASMSLDDFVAAVSRSALGTNNPAYTRQMAEHSSARVDELRAWGFFDSPLYANAFSKPLKERGIPVIERMMITHLLKEKGRIAGATGFSLDTPEVHTFEAKAVILCTGAGGFKPSGFPICDLTHDGTVMAYRIGAKVTGKEWNDGHVAQAENPAACFDGWHGMFERSPNVVGIGIRHDLGVDLNYRAYRNGPPVEMGPPGAAPPGETDDGPYRPPEFREGPPKDGHRGGAPGGPPPGGGPP
ncbi:MAG: FAD-binding protein, partial [Planctomycetota bacterium]